MTHPFPPGTKVQTNQQYLETFGRRVIGTSVAMPIYTPDPITVVRWEFQEGKMIPDHTGNAVIMMSRDLELYVID